MKILVDADACPRAARDILFRAVERLGIRTTLVANKPLRVPLSQFIEVITVSAGPDEADDRIVDLVGEEDLVITGDVPLADRVVGKGAVALDPRGHLLTRENVKERLATRDLLDTLRGAALVGGGPSAYGRRESQAFADALNGFLQARRPDPA